MRSFVENSWTWTCFHARLDRTRALQACRVDKKWVTSAWFDTPVVPDKGLVEGKTVGS